MKITIACLCHFYSSFWLFDTFFFTFFSLVCHFLLSKFAFLSLFSQVSVFFSLVCHSLSLSFSDTRVTSCELRVESLKARVEIQKCEFKSTSYKFKSTSYEFKSTSCEFESTTYEFESTSYEFESTSCKLLEIVRQFVRQLIRSVSGDNFLF